jgi:hypothetical protein
MLGKHSDLARLGILDCEGIPKVDARAVGETDDDGLLSREVAGYEAISLLATRSK